MSRVAVVCSISLLIAGCAKSDQAAKDSAAAAAAAPAAAAPAPPPPAPFSLADAAGKWQVRAVPVSGDTTPTNYVITATADTSGWVMTFPSGVKVPLHVMVSGDSAIVKTGTFPSQRRKNVKVSTEGSLKIQNGKLVGSTTAHYVNAGADSVLQLHIEGTKIP
jgi:hypothetical protein